VSQLNLPIPFRAVGNRLSRLFDLMVANWVDLSLKTVLLALYISIVTLAIRTGALFSPFSEVYETRIGAFLMSFGAIYSAIMLVTTAVRAIMVMSYRPMKALSDEQLPSVTVVIPAYNEGADVARSIDSIARSNYPREKLQIIAVDDGSKDDTWVHMEAAARRHPDIVCAIRMDINGGKRQGLRVGAVAGNVKVRNRNDGILPRMMRASFVIAFDFTRAYQAKIGAVLCTPGAFSAYRRSAIEAVLHDWNHQTFFGKPSTIAEDRALTNLILRDGHEITFQSDATVWTTVPTTYKQMARMYQRWERGNVRENLTYATFCWKPFRKRYRWAANVEWFLGTTDMVFPYVLIASSLLYSIINPFFALKYLAFVILFSAIMQGYYLMREKNTDCIYGVLYSLFYFTCLWWVVPYSIVTAANGNWMTRTLPQGSPAAPAGGIEVVAESIHGRRAA